MASSKQHHTMHVGVIDHAALHALSLSGCGVIHWCMNLCTNSTFSGEFATSLLCMVCMVRCSRACLHHLQGEVAAVAQSSCDAAAEMLQYAQHVEAGPCQGPGKCLRKPQTSGQHARRLLASQARAAAAARSSSFKPYDDRERRLEDCACLQACAAAFECTLASSLNAMAARAEANERVVQNLVHAVEETVADHMSETDEAVKDAVDGLARFLEVATTANSSPSESSIKQLVCSCPAGTICGCFETPETGLPVMHATAVTTSHAPWSAPKLCYSACAFWLKQCPCAGCCLEGLRSCNRKCSGAASKQRSGYWPGRRRASV